MPDLFEPVSFCASVEQTGPRSSARPPRTAWPSRTRPRRSTARAARSPSAGRRSCRPPCGCRAHRGRSRSSPPPTVRGQVRQHAAVVVPEEVARADQEEVRALTGLERGLQRLAVEVLLAGDVARLDLDVVVLVPLVADVEEPLALRVLVVGRPVEVPEGELLGVAARVAVTSAGGEQGPRPGHGHRAECSAEDTAPADSAGRTGRFANRGWDISRSSWFRGSPPHIGLWSALGPRWLGNRFLAIYERSLRAVNT